MITVITPTHDRPAAWPLLERWMARQTIQPDQWIVADDGDHPAPLTMGQEHLRVCHSHSGARSLSVNLVRAAKVVRGDVVFVMEDDDYYRADHIEVNLAHLEHADAAGCDVMAYYNVLMRKWMRLPNTGSALCNTAFVRSCLPRLVSAANTAVRLGTYHIDRYFWRSINRQAVHKHQTVVGIKGLPGTNGLGIGHRDGRRWGDDQSMSVLNEWIGNDARYYEDFYRP